MKPHAFVRIAFVLSAFVLSLSIETDAPSTMAQAPAPESDAEIAKLVESLVSRDYPTNRQERLQAAGKRATPAFVTLLNDRAKCEVIFKQFGILETSQLEWVAVHLNYDHAPDVVGPLARYLESAKPEVRAAAANGLGRIAAKECLTPMIKALADDEQRVVDHAIDGIDQAIEDEKYSPEFLAGIVPGLETLIRSRKSNGYDAPKTLAAIDRRRATVVFDSAEVCSLKNPNLTYVLDAVGEHGLKLDRAALLRLIGEVRPKLSLDNDLIYGGLLLAYGHNPDAHAETLLRAELKSEYGAVKFGAAKGLAAMKGVVNAEDFIERRYRKVGLKGLTPVQRHYYLSRHGDGSLKKFLESESGDDWKEMLEAIDAVGAVEQARCYRKAIALFGPQMPDIDCAKRNAQMSAWPPERKDALVELDYAFDRYEPGFAVLCALYTAEHPEDFRK